MIKGKTIILFTAHPDDEIRCSGTLAKLAQENKVILAVATSGDKGTHDPEISPEQIARIRHGEMEQAAAALGISHIEWLNYPDGSLYRQDGLKEKVFKMIRTLRPDVVITFDPFIKYDVHSDHIAIGRVVCEAAYLADGCWYFPQHMEEGIKAHKPKEVYLFNPEEANYSVDISSTLDKKIESARQHKSQFGANLSREELERRFCASDGESVATEIFHKMYASDLYI